MSFWKMMTMMMMKLAMNLSSNQLVTRRSSRVRPDRKKNRITSSRPNSIWAARVPLMISRIR